MEKVEELLDATRELLGKAIMKNKREPVIEPARASLIKKMTYAVIKLKKLDHTENYLTGGRKGGEATPAVRSLTLLGEMPDGSTITHIEKLDPLPSDNLKRVKGAQGSYQRSL